MTNQPDPHDADVDRALSALRSAQPPTGMEARILQTLEADRVAHSRAAISRVSGGVFAIFSSTFLRGALTGALIATAACIALFFALRPQHTPTSQTAASVQHSSSATPVALHTSDRCPDAPSLHDNHVRVPHPGSAWVENATTDLRVPHSSRALLRDEWEVRSSHHPNLIPASFAPSHPAPPAPPTAQERALIQFVRTATPAQLAALNRPSEPKSDAEREAAFNKFFAPSPEVLAIDEAQKKALGLTDNEPAAPKPSKEGQL